MVCGYLGNIRQEYSLGSDRLCGATGYSLIVLPRAKGGSRPLLEAFRRQPGVFAVSIFNANARSAPIYARNCFEAFPPEWADAKIVWPLAPERLARTVYRDRRPVRELFAGAAQRASRFVSPEVAALDPWTDAAEIDGFHEEIRKPDAVVASRSAKVFRERFSDPDATLPPMLLGWRDNGHLVALALAQVGKMSECEAAILDVIDLSWLDPHGRGPAGCLLAELRAQGRRIGASRLRLSILNPATAVVAQSVPGGIVRRGHIHAHVRFTGPVGDHPRWSPTPYDGDFGFFLRPTPPSVPTRSGDPDKRTLRFPWGPPVSPIHP